MSDLIEVSYDSHPPSLFSLDIEESGVEGSEAYFEVEVENNV